MNSGFLREDVTDPTGLGYLAGVLGAETTPDPTFLIEVGMALFREHIDYNSLNPVTYNRLVQQLWDDPSVQSYWNDPNTPSSGGIPNLASQLQYMLFSPSSGSDFVSQGMAMLQQANAKLTSEQEQFIVQSSSGGGATGNVNDTRQIIIEVAHSLGVDPALALAIAQRESGLNPNAVGDHGHSVGLFQLNDQGEGAGMSVAEREDPVRNATIALTEVAKVAAAHPDWSPGMIAMAAQRAQMVINGQIVGFSMDPAMLAASDYAQGINSGYDSIKSGKLPTQTSTPPLSPEAQQLKTTVDSLFRQYLGRNASPGELAQFVGLDAQQQLDQIRGYASHIPGMTVGAYNDLRQAADAASQKILGHNATDGIVTELFNGNHLTAQSITNWYNFHGISGNAAAGTTAVGGLPPAAYTAIYAANQPTMSGIFNQPTGFDPRVAIHQYQSIQHLPGEDKGVEAPPPTEQAQTAESLSFMLADAHAIDTPPPPLPHSGAKPVLDQ